MARLALWIVLAPCLWGCAEIDLRGVGAIALKKACEQSSHCDLPCDQDPARRDCASNHRAPGY